jgi:hypothetical protein
LFSDKGFIYNLHRKLDGAVVVELASAFEKRLTQQHSTGILDVFLNLFRLLAPVKATDCFWHGISEPLPRRLQPPGRQEDGGRKSEQGTSSRIVVSKEESKEGYGANRSNLDFAIDADWSVFDGMQSENSWKRSVSVTSY